MSGNCRPQMLQWMTGGTRRFDDTIALLTWARRSRTRPRYRRLTPVPLLPVGTDTRSAVDGPDGRCDVRRGTFMNIAVELRHASVLHALRARPRMRGSPH